MISILAHLRKLFGTRPLPSQTIDATERKSIETTQTDSSYTKDVEHEKQPIPASAWTLPLCDPLLNRLLQSRNATSSNITNTADNLKSPSSTSTICNDCRAEAEKEGFVVIEDPFATDDDDVTEVETEPEPEPVPVQETQETKCEFYYENGTEGGKKFVMELTEDMDNIVKPEEIILLVSMLEKLRAEVAGPTPITPSTRLSAKMIKARAASWGNNAVKLVDKLLKEEKAKVQEIWRKEEEGTEMD